MSISSRTEHCSYIWELLADSAEHAHALAARRQALEEVLGESTLAPETRPLLLPSERLASFLAAPDVRGGLETIHSMVALAQAAAEANDLAASAVPGILVHEVVHTVSSLLLDGQHGSDPRAVLAGVRTLEARIPQLSPL